MEVDAEEYRAFRKWRNNQDRDFRKPAPRYNENRKQNGFRSRDDTRDQKGFKKQNMNDRRAKIKTRWQEQRKNFRDKGKIFKRDMRKAYKSAKVLESPRNGRVVKFKKFRAMYDMAEKFWKSEDEDSDQEEIEFRKFWPEGDEDDG